MLQAIFKKNNTQNVYLFTKSLICFYSPSSVIPADLLNFITLLKMIDNFKYKYNFSDFMKIYNTFSYSKQTLVFLNYIIKNKKVLDIKLISQFIKTIINKDNVYCKKLFLLEFAKNKFDVAKKLCEMSDEYHFLNNCSNILLKNEDDICS